MTPISFDDPVEKRKRYAWSIAVECSHKTKESALDIYHRLMKEFEETNESNKT